MTGGAAAITGTGLVTPAGTDVDATWAALSAARSPGSGDPGPLEGTGVWHSLRVPPLGEQLTGRGTARTDPFIRFALVAVDQALGEAGLDPGVWDGSRVGVVVGCGLGGVTTLEEGHQRLSRNGPEMVSPYMHPRSLINMAAGTLAMRLGITGPSHTVVAACASGAAAIGLAKTLLDAGTCDTVIACGTDAGVTPLVVSGFARMGALSRHKGPDASRPFAADRDGFVISEGAGAVVLERPATALARHARVLGRLLGYGSTSDAYHPVSPHPEGVGAEAAVRQALDQAGLVPKDVGTFNAHGTSTPQNDRSEAQLIARVFPHGPSVTANKGLLGHTLGASGAIEAVLTLRSLRTGTVPPIAHTVRADPDLPDIDLVLGGVRRHGASVAVSTSFGFGGSNSALVLDV
ncbi:beta-ketoacyl-[acyl-carrier-protein] synthase family protein [Streptomyces sp. NPDC057939]|uniref:beta-ketoacyl-[acyl-carrier-protein] synthase family protein n=1 Tax=Streptomyces sp. NPDC057939 TaxID=3346284 RepID=UPI0036E97477